jgi:hypothetical protein
MAIEQVIQVLEGGQSSLSSAIGLPELTSSFTTGNIDYTGQNTVPNQPFADSSGLVANTRYVNQKNTVFVLTASADAVILTQQVFQVHGGIVFYNVDVLINIAIAATAPIATGFPTNIQTTWSGIFQYNGGISGYASVDGGSLICAAALAPGRVKMQGFYLTDLIDAA